MFSSLSPAHNKVSRFIRLSLLLSLFSTGCASTLDANTKTKHTEQAETDGGVTERTFEVVEEIVSRADIDEWLEAQMLESSLVGLGVAVVQGNKIQYLKGFGFADREAQRESDPKKTLWRLASLSKGMTGVIATRLDAREEIDLDAPIPSLPPVFSVPTTYLPQDCDEVACVEEVPDTAEAINLDLLLHHRAGIPHYSNGLGDPAPPQEHANNPQKNSGIRWALQYLNEKPLLHLPGTKFDYTSFGYNLAGVVLEELTQKSFDELLVSELATPAQLRTIQVDRLWETHPDAAIGYHRSDGLIERDERWDVSWKAPGGGLIASVEDMAKYCSALMLNQLTDEARDKVLWKPAGTGNYAHGFIVKTTDSKVVEHSGSQQGARTGLHIRVDDNLCVIAMSNTTTLASMTLVRALADLWTQ